MKRHIAFTGLLCLIGLTFTVRAADPAWWTNSSAPIIDPNADHSTSANYAPANLGQLKNVAAQAKAYLDNNLSGGAGQGITTEVAGFSTDPSLNYAPVNLGQLKAVAAPFYDRLLSAGYDTRANLIARGYPSGWPSYYPWALNTPTSENYAPANIGQIKMVFSFGVSSLAAGTLVDSNSNDLPDWWESTVAGGNSGGATGDWNGDGIKNVTELVATSGSGELQAGDGSSVELNLFTEVQ
jgi:hypothetical protein